MVASRTTVAGIVANLGGTRTLREVYTCSVPDARGVANAGVSRLIPDVLACPKGSAGVVADFNAVSQNKAGASRRARVFADDYASARRDEGAVSIGNRRTAARSSSDTRASRESPVTQTQTSR